MKFILPTLFCISLVLTPKMASAVVPGDEEADCPKCSNEIHNLALDGSSIDTIPVPAPFNFPQTDYVQQKDYSHVDPENLIPRPLLKQALDFYDLNLNRFKVPKYVNVIDFSLHASKKRMYLIDIDSGAVKAMHTSVGRKTDPDGDGIADIFSNIEGSNMSSLGFYLTDDEYMGGNGRSMRLHGLSPTNSNALTRYIVVHGAAYISEVDNHAGRSLGCPAVDLKHNDELIERTKNGSLMFIWHPTLQP
jgi:hypothetical protein